MARRHDPFDKQSAAFSVLFHVMLFVLAWVSTLGGPPEFEFLTYEIELVSPPTTLQAETEQSATEELVVEQPDPTPTAPEPEPEQEEVAIEEEVKPDPPKPDPQPVEELSVEEETLATTTEEVPEDATESGEDINVRLEGVRRDYPVYYSNIIRQIQNCFRPPRGIDGETTVFFYILADGSVTGMEFVSRSGNFDFDFSAMGAVECAGGGRFGPLPDELPYDRLPIRFDFRPARDIQATIPATRPSVVGVNPRG